MKLDHSLYVACLCLLVMMSGCSKGGKEAPPPAEHAQEAAVAPAYHVDSLTAGSISGTIRFAGKRPPRKVIDMSEEPGCVEAHHGRAMDESLVVSSNGSLANAFIYVKTGLEGKRFETPSTPAVIDQNGCWFKPRVLGIQTSQPLQITNSDPVTHNIHPMAQLNREWNHSQGAGDAPLGRKFTKPEVMIRVKCNIHHWMHAFIGVLDNPYFAVTNQDGRYSIKNLPPGSYTIDIWQESLGIQERQVTISPHSNTQANITFKGQ